MNLTATMSKNPEAFLNAAGADAHARHAAILACDSREDLYSEARSMGLSDQQIIANANAELHEHFDDEAWANGEYEAETEDGEEEVDPELARRLSTENIRFGNTAEALALVARMEESGCE